MGEAVAVSGRYEQLRISNDLARLATEYTFGLPKPGYLPDSDTPLLQVNRGQMTIDDAVIVEVQQESATLPEAPSD